MNFLPHTPKQNSAYHGKSSWYNYYAGYSEQFTHDILNEFKLTKEQAVLDPWNGGGTTTQIANDMGIKSYGYDINPVMVIVAKGRLLDSNVSESISSLSQELLIKSRSNRNNCFYIEDPLEIWFSKQTSSIFRNLDISIQELLIDDKNYRILYNEKQFDFMSSLAAFFYIALFRTIREFILPFRSSNPTWIKTPRDTDQLVDSDTKIIEQSFIHQIDIMRGSLNQYFENSNCNKHKAIIDLGSSLSIPLSDGSVAAVVCSPPYCTRIDYAISTRPELAVLGCTQSGMRDLRSNMIGTPTITGQDINIQESWGSTCLSFLKSVEGHSAKSSKSYYFKTFTQYFNSTYISLKEIERVLTKDGKCTLVVQDSYYKDLHNDLATIISDFASSNGLKLLSRYDFVIRQTMASVHQHGKNYRQKNNTSESVLMFAKS